MLLLYKLITLPYIDKRVEMSNKNFDHKSQPENINHSSDFGFNMSL